MALIHEINYYLPDNSTYFPYILQTATVLVKNVYQYCKRNVKLNFGTLCEKISVRAFEQVRLPQPQSQIV